MPGAIASITCSDGDGLRVETTSLAVLAWLRARELLQRHAPMQQRKGSAQDVERLHFAATRGVQWILTQNRGGRFGTTQATVLALKAITKLDATNFERRVDPKFSLFDSNGKAVAEGTMRGVMSPTQAKDSLLLSPVLLEERLVL